MEVRFLLQEGEDKIFWMPYEYMRYFISYIFISCVCICGAQHPFENHALINYTVDDGLPSNECHQILQDSLGYIWIASDRGLVRYDGYDFKTYGIGDGLMDISCLDIILDVKQNIWIRTYSGKIFVYDRNSDDIGPYRYQESLNSFYHLTKVLDFGVDEELNAVFTLDGIGTIFIDSNGYTSLDRCGQPDSLGIFFTRQIGYKLLSAHNNRGPAPDFEVLSSIKAAEFSSYEYGQFKVVHDSIEVIVKGIKRYNVSNLEAFRLSDTTGVVTVNGEIFVFRENRKPISRNYVSEIEDVKFMEGQGYLTSETNSKGVKFFASLDHLVANDYQLVLENVSATSSFIDGHGGLWVSTLRNGVYRLKINPITVLDSIPKKNIKDIATFKNQVVFVEGKKGVRYFTSSEDSPKNLIVDEAGGLNSLAFDPYESELVVCMVNPSVLVKDFETTIPIGHKFELEDTSYEKYTYFKEAFVLSSNEIIGAHADNFMVYKDLDELPIYHSYLNEDLIKVLGASRLDYAHYLLGTNGGLKEFKNFKINDLDNCPEELEIRINEIARLNDYHLFATQGNGLVIWDTKDELIQRTTDSGLISDNIEDIYVDKQDNIYLSTKAGISKLWFDEKDSLVIRNFTTFHGLPSNEVNGVTERNDTIFIATGKGIALLEGEIPIAPVHNVLIEEMIVNDKEWDQNKEELKFEENNIKIHFRTIDHTLEGNIDYRYRLNKGQWTSTNATYVNFASLQPDDYTFEVQSKNRDNVWSASSSRAFVINPPWYRSWWVYSLYVLMLGGIAYSFYKIRTRRLRLKLETEREIRDLERSALQAQMNPHFIFNCLNSIQRFIQDNEKDRAMDYLAKFARLVRQSLTASTESKILLDQEISMLDNYLALEKLRFKNRFDYSINIADNIDPLMIRIPPLLIQPYVENAVVHGMKNKDRGGLILISFKIEEENLFVAVKDNGSVNFDSTVPMEEHKSLGMSITQKRIAHNNNLNSTDFKIEPIYSSEGTEVNITITV